VVQARLSAPAGIVAQSGLQKGGWFENVAAPESPAAFHQQAMH
jgi:hypothetical protein